jgi:CRP/FNR family cyclic AMP-dependent transcriptional regulator
MQSPLLEMLSETDRQSLLARARRRKFARREVVFHEGDPGDSLHLVTAGHVGLRITTPLGDTAMVRVVGPGEFFGELALLTPGNRSATAFAIESAETQSLSRELFEELQAQSPASHIALTAALAHEVRRLAGALVEALYLPAEKRLWKRLSDLAGAYGYGAPVPLTQEEIAQLAGTTRQSVNKALRNAEQANAVLITRGRLLVTDPDWLARQAR